MTSRSAIRAGPGRGLRAPLRMTGMTESLSRRPLKTRQRAWARDFARVMVGAGMSPNQMSLLGLGFALLCAAAYWQSISAQPLGRSIVLIAAAVFIQLRLLANMLDGLMAVEEGQKTATGALYNELPDRAADAVILVAAGYAAGWPWLGWLAAILALMTAYVRALGGSLGFAQDFCGPMAKPHRMFALTVGNLAAALAPQAPILGLTLAVIVVGTVVTVIRRTRRLARNLSEHPA